VPVVRFRRLPRRRDGEEIAHIEKKSRLAVWHAPPETRCSGGLSYTHVVVCQLRAPPPSALPRDVRAPLVTAAWARTTDPLTTFSTRVYICVLVACVISVSLATTHLAIQGQREGGVIVKTTAVGTARPTTSRSPLFFWSFSVVQNEPICARCHATVCS